MARSRNIKPGFFLNDKLGELPPLARILFEGLWCIADREGRLEDKPKRIKAETLPYDDCDIEVFLNQLADSGFIHRYEVDGSGYIEVSNFKKHQKPHPKEIPSVIPAPRCGKNTDSSGNSAPCRENSVPIPSDSLLSFPSDSLLSDSLSTEEGGPDAAGDIEKEFGRTLSPMETEQVEHWEQKHKPEVILEAVRIAVLKGVYNLTYIDRILLGWERSKLKTITQVQEYEKKRSAARSKAPPGKSNAGNLTGETIKTKGLYEI